jgi:hypothetical protein
VFKAEKTEESTNVVTLVEVLVVVAVVDSVVVVEVVVVVLVVVVVEGVVTVIVVVVVVVSRSVSNEDITVSIEVEDIDKYLIGLDISSVVPFVFPLLVLDISPCMLEIN